jgi:hypothetical protein
MAPKCDLFALARIMGHSSIVITQRYVHTQAEAIEMAFQKVVTEGGHREESQCKDDDIDVLSIITDKRG